jgi:outer membrane protein TolC
MWVVCLCFAQQSLYGQAPAPAAAAPFTMQQAVDYALAHNPTLASAQQNLFSMKGQEVEAGLRQNPNFSLVWRGSQQSCYFRYTLRLQFTTGAAL